MPWLAGAVVLAAVGIGTLFLFGRHARALTDKDTVVLSEFVNTTGDSVFDGTLKQALSVQLEQSPYLNLLPESKVQEALRYMGRKPDERITKDLAREISLRTNAKAIISGSITNLGSNYVITLEAANSQTGDSLARQQAEATSKEQVLKSLDTAASKLRQKLGESITSVQQFATPLEQATTSSLEALKEYSIGNGLHLRLDDASAGPHLKRAIELEMASSIAGAQAVRDAFAGFQESARQKAAEALRLPGERTARSQAALALAQAGDTAQAQKLSEELNRDFPSDYFIKNFISPSVQALNLLHRNKAAEAIAILEPGRRYELGAPIVTPAYTTIYCRGLAYLQLRDGGKAAAEFQKILDHRGVNSLSELLPLAQLQLARAYVLQGDNAKGRTAYQDFFAAWKDADSDIPVLIQAKAEYAKLPQDLSPNK